MHSTLLKRSVLLFVLCIASLSISFANEACGTSKFIEYQHKPKKFATESIAACNTEDYFDSVYTKQTKHFAIFYTLDGPHATTEIFVDSVAKSMEAAYELLTGPHQMRAPKGFNTSWHYQKKVPQGLYSVEIIEMDMVRQLNSLMGSECHGCFALTIPDKQETDKSTIFIDNDFKYIPKENQEIAFYQKGSKSCPYSKSTRELYNIAHNYSFAKEFGKGIRVTSFHELLHAVQSNYLDWVRHPTYWLESSASGFEEIGAPDVDDYQRYTTLSSMNWTSFYTTSKYSLAPFYIGMYTRFGPTFDTKIWEHFSKNPTQPFEEHYASVVKQFQSDANIEFHNFAVSFFYSGSHFSKEHSFHNDQKAWPNTQVPLFSNAIDENAFPFFTYRYTTEYPLNTPGKVSFLIKSSKDSVFKNIEISSISDYRKKMGMLFEADTSILVYSRLTSEKKQLDSLPKGKFFVYPNPWKANEALCFANIPASESLLEIRTRKGSLIKAWETNSTNYCIGSQELKELLAPGLYFYRAGRKGKMEKLVVIY